MNEFIAELIGTMLLMLLGNGVVANVLLKDTKGNDSGWIVITFGWGMAVFVAVFTVGDFSGAHLNPAVTIGLAIAGTFELAKVPIFILAQFIGSAIGTTLVWIFYYQHFERTDDPDAVKSCFCNTPAIRNIGLNIFSEIIGTFVLVFAVLYIASPSLEAVNLKDVKMGLGAIGALPVGLLVFAIGLSLGGTTGYAINPARDLIPRLMHQILPIKGKGDSDWSYSWIPVLGPVLGALLAGGLYLLVSI